jgi:hypothetical protein
VQYKFRQFYIPERMMGPLLRYIQDHVRPGQFLCAVISNDLKEAIGRADDENIANLPAYVAYLYNEAPAVCWGSPKHMENWILRGKVEKTQKIVGALEKGNDPIDVG